MTSCADTTVWTQEDVAWLNEAIRKKASGQRLTAEDLGGKMQQWADAPLDQLMELRDKMVNEIGATAPGDGSATSRRSMVLRARYSKGL